jgi:hypothetical protein
MNNRTKLAALALVPAGLLSTAAMAQDVTAVVTAIDGAAAPIAAIGGAVLLVLVGIKVYKWVRRAM